MPARRERSARCSTAAVAAIATAFLALPGRQPIRVAAMEVAS